MSDFSGRGDPGQGDIYNDRRKPGGTQPRREEPRGGDRRYRSPAQQAIESPFKPTHTYQPIGWDQFDPHPHPGSRPIIGGSPVQKLEQMSPAHGKMTLHHVRDEQGNHQSVAIASLGKLVKDPVSGRALIDQSQMAKDPNWKP